MTFISLQIHFNFSLLRFLYNLVLFINSVLLQYPIGIEIDFRLRFPRGDPKICTHKCRLNNRGLIIRASPWKSAWIDCRPSSQVMQCVYFPPHPTFARLFLGGIRKLFEFLRTSINPLSGRWSATISDMFTFNIFIAK